MNPASQLGSLISWSSTLGLSTGVILGKDSIKFGDKPLFTDALRHTILCNPSIVRCSFFVMISIICLKSSKSARFWVIKGYLSKPSSSPPPHPRAPTPPLSNLPPLPTPPHANPRRKSGLCKRGVGGRRMGTPPPSASMWLAHGCIHLYQRWTLSPPISFPPHHAVVGGCKGGWGGGCSQPPSCFAADGAKQPPSCFAADGAKQPPSCFAADGAKQPPSCFAADGAKQPPSCFAADGYGGSPREPSHLWWEGARGGFCIPWRSQGKVVVGGWKVSLYIYRHIYMMKPAPPGGERGGGGEGACGSIT
nr:hypothetical protein [Morchella crassipes]